MEPRRSVSRGFDLTPDLLATQGRALRGLARSLLGDAHAAEDVVQETWLACLRHPGAFPERVSAWLGTVTKHLALHRLRGEGRRSVRELRAAMPERMEALQQRTLEREEALRAVTQALLALEEPYKTALFLRFYEDRTPNEIAEELELPISTVKSRLARGLERMRAKLGAEFDGDEARRMRALHALAALPAPGVALATSAAASSTIGALALSTKLQVAAAALVLAGGAALWWSSSGGAQREVASASDAGTPAASVGAVLAQGGAGTKPAPVTADVDSQSAEGARRESVDPARSEPSSAEAFPPEAAYAYSIAGQVRDENDLPLAGARVFLAPRGFPINCVAKTDDEGRFALSFSGRRPALDCAFTVDGGGRGLGFQELHLVAGQELALDVSTGPLATNGRALVAMRDAEIIEVALHERGELAAEKLLYRFEDASDPEPIRGAARVLGSLLRLAGHSSEALDCAPAAIQGASGRVWFVDPPPSGACARETQYVEFAQFAFEGELALASKAEAERQDVVKQMLEEEIVSGVKAFRLGELAAAKLELDVAVKDAPRGTMRGVVRDALGNPQKDVEIVCSGAEYRERALSDENGAYLLENVPAGALVGRVGAGDRGRALTNVTLAAGEDLTWDPVLERGDEVAGRIVLARGENALSDVLVELWSVSPSFVWCDATLTGEDGRFSIPNVPAGALELHVYASGPMDPPSTLPVHVVRPLFAPAELGDVVLAVNEITSHTLALRVLAPNGEPLPGAQMRVWSATGRGFFAAKPDDEGKLALAGLPQGNYRVEAGGPFGWRDLGMVWLAEDTELPPVRFARPGFLQFGIAPEGLALATTLWSAHPDVFGRVDARSLDDARKLGLATLMLRAGDYVLCAGSKERRSETPLAMEPGTARSLVIDPGSDALTVQPGTLATGLGASAQETNCSACHASTGGD